MSFQEALAVSKDIKERFPDIYRIILGFLEPSIVHVILGLAHDDIELHQVLIDECKNGNLEFVKYLITKGVDLRKDDDLALRWASMKGHLEVVRFLVDGVLEGANVRALNDDALGTASRYGHIKVVKFLVSKGADVRAFGDNPLIWASMNGHLEVVKFLVSKDNSKNLNNLALTWAEHNGHDEIVQYLRSKIKRSNRCTIV